MDIDELFSKDDTGAGTLTMISAEMIGLLKEYLDKQSEVCDVNRYTQINTTNTFYT